MMFFLLAVASNGFFSGLIGSMRLMNGILRISMELVSSSCEVFVCFFAF
jgi:hypothetical protein